ncbi:MAG: hypothetical protein F4Y47_00200 [Acidobacteriia bacterium]|nr:hypothetical protein [Terriglobia bacterium]MYG04415.1 hypothetical protein [Terriglobia bacterium]MYK11280.1 hypothetical protein [Terriglobia bacterium]
MAESAAPGPLSGRTAGDLSTLARICADLGAAEASLDLCRAVLSDLLHFGAVPDDQLLRARLALALCRLALERPGRRDGG